MELGLKDHLCSHLYIASRLIVQAYGEELKDYNLTYLRYLVLLALKENNGQTVSQLGEVLALDSGTLSPLLKELLKLGYIERTRLPEDERTVVNKITSKGKKACQKGCEVAYRLFQETGLCETDFVRFRSSMEDFVDRCKNILDKKKISKIKTAHLKRKKDQTWKTNSLPA